MYPENIPCSLKSIILSLNAFSPFLLAESQTRDLLGTAHICRCNYALVWNISWANTECYKSGAIILYKYGNLFDDGMIKLLLNLVIAKYRDLPLSRRSFICNCVNLWLRQTIDLLRPLTNHDISLKPVVQYNSYKIFPFPSNKKKRVQNINIKS